MTSHYIYLHGFASSSQSVKAHYLRDRFTEVGIPLQLPDLNQGDFSNLTLTRQLQQVESLFRFIDGPTTLIGSSFGGLTAAWLAQRHTQVKQVILLAPAFNFLSHWLPKLGEEQVKQWQDSGYMAVYHYGERRSLPLHYSFITDAQQYPDHQLQRPVPTLILHGIHDEVIPIESSRNYATQRPWVSLVELNSDHGLIEVLPDIWQEIQHFCSQSLPNSLM